MSSYGYIRTSLKEREGERGMNSDVQRKQLLDAGVDDSNIYSDVAVSGVSGIAERNGWKALSLRLKEADTLVIAALDRIGRNHVDTWAVVSDLNRRRVRIRSLAEQETFLRALDADPSSPEWFAASLIGQVMAWGGVPRERGRQKAHHCWAPTCPIRRAVSRRPVQDEGGGTGGGCC